jgi:hypothetical protein
VASAVGDLGEEVSGAVVGVELEQPARRMTRAIVVRKRNRSLPRIRVPPSLIVRERASTVAREAEQVKPNACHLERVRRGGRAGPSERRILSG